LEGQLLQKHIDALGEEFGRVFHAVWSEWCSAKVRYEELRELFGTQENCDLLNAVAPEFFASIQQLFWHDLLLYVTRLTDKSKKALKLQSLERFLRDEPDLLKRVVQHRLEAAVSAEPATEWRNRSIAHRDQSLATGNSPKPLPGVRLRTCGQVLDQVHAALSAIQLHYMDSSIANMVSYNPTAGALVAHLRGLVEGVRFIASIIDPEDPNGFDLEKGRAFLRKLDRSEPGDSNRVYDLMDIARRCQVDTA